MRLSVIIPSREEDFFIRRLLAFLDPYDLEVIVCACGDAGETPAICAEFGARYIHSPVANRAIQMNAGATAATGDAFLFLHADVLPPANFPALIENALQEGAAFGCFSFRFDSPMKKLAFNARQTRKDNIFQGGGDQCQFYQKQFFEKLGGYRGDYVVMEDFELYRRAKMYGKHQLIREDALVSARKYEKNSYEKVQLANGVAFGMFLAGIKPALINNFYKRIIQN